MEKLKSIASPEQNYFAHFAMRYPVVVQNGHFELRTKEKSEFEPEEKKFSFLWKMEVCCLKWLENSTFSDKMKFFLEFRF